MPRQLQKARQWSLIKNIFRTIFDRAFCLMKTIVQETGLKSYPNFAVARKR